MSLSNDIAKANGLPLVSTPRATPSTPNITHTGDVLGTLRYMAPEVFNAKGDARSEIYSLGLTLYELLTLRPAYDESDRNKLIKQVTTAEPAPLEKVNRDVPRDLATIVHKAIEKDAAHRYQTARGLAEDLQRFLDDEPIQTRRISVTERFLRWSRRNKAVASLTVAVFTLLVVGTAISAYFAVNSIRNAARATKLLGQKNEALKKQIEATKTANAAETNQRKAKETLRRGLYVSDMNLARLLYNEGALDRLRKRLEQHIPKKGESDLRGFEWYYWHRMVNLHVASFRTEGPPFQIAASPDGITMASAHYPQHIRIYDSTTNTFVKQITIKPPKAGDREPLALAFSPDGSTLLAAWPESIIHRFATRTWAEQPNLGEHKPGSKIVDISVASSVPHMVSADDKKYLVLWDTKTWKPFGRFLSEIGIRQLALSPDGKNLACVLETGQIARAANWSPGSRKIMWSIVPKIKIMDGYHDRASMTFGPGGNWLAVCADHRITGPRVLLFGADMQLLHEFNVSSKVLSVAFSPYGNHLAAGAGLPRWLGVNKLTPCFQAWFLI